MGIPALLFPGSTMVLEGDSVAPSGSSPVIRVVRVLCVAFEVFTCI